MHGPYRGDGDLAAPRPLPEWPLWPPEPQEPEPKAKRKKKARKLDGRDMDVMKEIDLLLERCKSLQKAEKTSKMVFNASGGLRLGRKALFGRPPRLPRWPVQLLGPCFRRKAEAKGEGRNGSGRNSHEIHEYHESRAESQWQTRVEHGRTKAMLHTYTSQKSRNAVKNWPAYLWLTCVLPYRFR